MSTRTPWGASQGAEEYADGIVFHTTASHGGFKLSAERNAKVPSYMRRLGGWYEEDSEWAIVATVFPDAFEAETAASAKGTLRNWEPDAYTRFYGEAIAPGTSYIADGRTFQAEHANDYVATAAWGSWHEKVPKGLVGVVASPGGNREGRDQRYFLVPDAEYSTRAVYGFVIDTARHAKWEDHA
jgi:hypothetical protein